MQNSLWINSCAFFLFLAIGQGQNLNQSRQNQRKVFQDVNNNQLLIWTCYFYFRSLKSVEYWDLDYDSHEKREYSVAGSLYWVLFPAELEFDTRTQVTSEYLKCKDWMCWKIKTIVFFMSPASSSTDMSSFYCSDINPF